MPETETAARAWAKGARIVVRLLGYGRMESHYIEPDDLKPGRHIIRAVFDGQFYSVAPDQIDPERRCPNCRAVIADDL